MIGGTPLDFDFSAERYRLQPVMEDDLAGGPVPPEWSHCLVFGEYDYAEGGGASPWIAIRQTDRLTCGLDIERAGETVFVFNSSLERFIQTFTLIDQYLRDGREVPPDFATRVRLLDPDVFPVSDWKELIDLVLAG